MQLLALDLLDETPELEARRNIICAPLRSTDGLAARLALELTERLAELPELPSKFGFAIDVDGPPQLGDAPADIRIETGPYGLIVRADGSPRGAAVTAGTAINELINIARWFTQTRDNDIRRMAPHLGSVPLPLRFARETSHKPAPQLVPGQLPQARVFGAPFGSSTYHRITRVIVRKFNFNTDAHAFTHVSPERPIRRRRNQFSHYTRRT